jgi:hypothetical protein
MGQATDRKLIEIDETRRRLENDLRELEARVPGPVRSIKGVVGAIVGSAFLSALAVRMLRSKRSSKPAAEVVVRVVREDRPADPERR